MACGAYGKSSSFLRIMTWKGYHSKISTGLSKEVGGRQMDRSESINSHVDGSVGAMWIPHQRTGIYYPEGQERIMDDIPIEAANCMEEIHPFSSNKAVRAFSASQ